MISAVENASSEPRHSGRMEDSTRFWQRVHVAHHPVVPRNTTEVEAVPAAGCSWYRHIHAINSRRWMRVVGVEVPFPPLPFHRSRGCHRLHQAVTVPGSSDAAIPRKASGELDPGLLQVRCEFLDIISFRLPC